MCQRTALVPFDSGYDCLGRVSGEIEAWSWLVDYMEGKKEVGHVWVLFAKFACATEDLIVHLLRIGAHTGNVFAIEHVRKNYGCTKLGYPKSAAWHVDKFGEDLFATDLLTGV